MRKTSSRGPLLNLKEQRRELVHKNRCHFTSERKSIITALTKKIKQTNRRLKSKHYENLLDEHQNDGRRVWEILKEVTRSKEIPEDKLPCKIK